MSYKSWIFELNYLLDIIEKINNFSKTDERKIILTNYSYYYVSISHFYFYFNNIFYITFSYYKNNIT